MSGQSILVFLPDTERAGRLIDIAKKLVRGKGGRLVGVHAGAQYLVYPSAGYAIPPEVYQAQVARSRERGQQIEKVFEQAMDGESVDSAWRYIDSGSAPAADRVMPLARCCDFVVAEMAQTQSESDPFGDLGETLALGSGRPVLLVPSDAKTEAPLRDILLAWDGSREAARAAFDALPLLIAAKEVHLVSVEEQVDRQTLFDVPAAEIAVTLAAHGVTCTTHRVTKGNEDTGEALLRTASETGADMIVMGLYGHSRLREFVFGGATRRVLKNAAVPIFVSH